MLNNYLNKEVISFLLYLDIKYEDIQIEEDIFELCIVIMKDSFEKCLKLINKIEILNKLNLMSN